MWMGNRRIFNLNFFIATQRINNTTKKPMRG